MGRSNVWRVLTEAHVYYPQSTSSSSFVQPPPPPPPPRSASLPALPAPATPAALQPSPSSAGAAASPKSPSKGGAAKQQPQKQPPQQPQQQQPQPPPARKGPPAELKPALSKAERREVQEAQRAAKAAKSAPPAPPPAAGLASSSPPTPGRGGPRAGAGGGGGSGGAPSSAPAPGAAHTQQPRPSSGGGAGLNSFGGSGGGGGGSAPPAHHHGHGAPRPPPDHRSRVVDLFSHLPQSEGGGGARLAAALERCAAASSPVPGPSSASPAVLHPAVLRLGVAYAEGSVVGGRARCLALLSALRLVVASHVTPPEKAFARDVTARINGVVQFLADCRPLGTAMGNAIKALKTAVADVGARGLGEAEAKAVLDSHLNTYASERILLADKVIESLALANIRDGDVVLTHAASATVLGALLAAKAAGKLFRVVVVDARPRLEGRATLAALLTAGVSCTYCHPHALSYAMGGATLVLLGAAAVLANGCVVSRAGAAAVAAAAKAAGVPVLVLAQTCKLHERVQLDSITYNELGDPTALVSVADRPDVAFLSGHEGLPSLRLLNLMYDATPADLVTAIVTEVGMLPPTSVPVVLREYRKDNSF